VGGKLDQAGKDHTISQTAAEVGALEKEDGIAHLQVAHQVLPAGHDPDLPTTISETAAATILGQTKHPTRIFLVASLVHIRQQLDQHWPKQILEFQ
jgi:hypothetical protein